MVYDVRKEKKHCRWCGIEYYASKPPNQDGFCSPAHRQAHYRAYKNYVTAIRLAAAGSSKPRITHKKHK